ncbi:GAF domain-containing protein [Thermosynechococcus sp. HN-54]|uniref:PAS domain-containing sensor histidine kinase n=1 Tax=Thermosynechococcus sp. HN-54 TaxID=2933959 RepID=UPI00202CE694|nr:GAF domain-containing protein [Thermosynechococcus sp. HN-54]URR35278.1 GAF domain-containing protein [Thermosynechococcus sp. HN-54]
MTPVIEQLQSLNRILVELARRQPFHGANFEEILQDILCTSARSLNVARVSLWFYSGDRQHIECVHLFQHSPQEFTAGMRLTASDYPRYFAALQEERTITAHDAWVDPRTQEFRQSYLEPLGITSLLDVPIWVEGVMIGILCYEHVGPPRQWTIAEEQFAASLADLVSLAVESRDRHRALKALEESEDRLATFFQATSEAVIIHEQGQILDVNAAAERLFGYTASELVGQSVLLLTHPESRSLILERIEQPLDVPFEALARTKRGETLIVEVQGKSILYRGRWARVLGVRDITQRKAAEQNAQLAAQRQQLLAEIALRIRQTLELPDILSTTVVEVRRYLLSDRVFIVSFEPRTEEIQIVAADMAPQWHTNLEALLHNVHYRSRLLTTPATLSCDQSEIADPQLQEVYEAYHIQSCLLIPIQHQPDGKCFLLGVHQCDRKREWQPYERAFLEQLAIQVAIALQQAALYQQLAALNANLEHQVAERTEQLQQKMRELEELNHLKDVFLHAVSHDLRTPVLGTLMVINHLLQTHSSETIPVPRSTLTCIQQSQQRQLHLIETLLHIHVDQQSLPSLAIAPTALAALVNETLTDLQPLLQKNKATVKLDIPPTLPLVPVDPMQLRRVYENLITNALKHNRPGLRITLTAEAQGDMVYCTVQDNGVGIRSDQRSRLFDLYYRGSESHHRTGIGLGLYLCRQIITAHGGEIGIEDNHPRGAIFWFRIPIARPT